MIRRSRVALTIVTATAFALGAAGCSAEGAPRPTATQTPTPTPSNAMDRAASKAAFDRVYRIVAKTVGPDSWDGRASWFDCTDGDGPERTQYTFSATRRIPLTGGPDTALEGVRDALRGAGFDVTIQHDRAAGTTAIGYPHGFNGGTTADGYGWEVVARDSGIAFGGSGHCIPGSVPAR